MELYYTMFYCYLILKLINKETIIGHFKFLYCNKMIKINIGTHLQPVNQYGRPTCAVHKAVHTDGPSYVTI